METERRDVRGQDGEAPVWRGQVHAACGETRLVVYYWLAEEHPNIHNGKMT